MKFVRRFFVLAIGLLLIAAAYMYWEHASTPSGDSVPATENEGDVQVYTNPDENATIAAVADMGEGNGISFMRSKSGVVQTAIIRAADGSVAGVDLDTHGRPTGILSNGYRLEFRNYTDTTVEITGIAPNGTRTEVGAVPWQPSESVSFLPTTHAEFLWGYYPKTIGQIAGTVGCGYGSAAAVLGWPYLAPLAIFNCATIAVRVVTSPTAIGPCTGDVVECGMNAILEVVQDIGPQWLKSWSTLRGNIRNAVTGEPITKSAVIGLLDAEGNTVVRGKITSNTTYEQALKKTGEYTLSVVAIGYKDTQIPVRIRETSVQLTDAKSTSLNTRSHTVFHYDIDIEPDGIILGEVIDTEAEGIASARVTLRINGQEVETVKSDELGEFIFLSIPVRTPVASAAILVEADGWQSATVPIGLTYNLKDLSDRYDLGGSWNEVIKLQPLQEELVPDTLAALSGPQSFNITFDFSHSGIRHRGNGQLSLTLGGAASCLLSLNGSAFGVPHIPDEVRSQIPPSIDLPAIEGSFSGLSQSCTGSLDSGGAFALRGSLEGTAAFTIGPQQIDDTDTYSFTVNGQIDGANVSGSIVIDGTATIPFE